MQIELIGCTSAGKSTLAQSILQACDEGRMDILSRDDFVLSQIRLNWVKGHLPRTLLVDLAALFACLATWRNNHNFYFFATQLLLQLPIPRFEKLQLLRNVLKKMGIYEIIRFRRRGQQIVLVDEGILQIAHNLFVHVSVAAKKEDLSTFAEFVPLPDVVVYLKQPEELLIDRAMKRGHKRIPDRSYAKVAPFIKRAVAAFDLLVQHPAIENKVLIVDGNQEVVRTGSDQVDPTVALALKIIRRGFTDGAARTPTEIPFTPDPYPAPAPSASLLKRILNLILADG